MNWVGGTMSRIRGRDDRKIQREFFEKKRYEKTLDSIPAGLQSPSKKRDLAISQDLLSLQTVLQTHREDNNRLNRPVKQPNLLDLKPRVGQKRAIPYDLMQGGSGRDQMSEGFLNLETPTNFIDLKRWRGENKQYKTLGMSKVPNLRHFQELEQTVYQREGVDVQTEEESAFPQEERDNSLSRNAGLEIDDKSSELIRDQTKGSIHWNKNVCGEANTSVVDAKWLEFLYGCNKPRQQQARILNDNPQADITTQFPSVQLPVPSSRPLSPHLNPANLEYYETEDLMEFERMNFAKSQAGKSEDPLYLTLTCNKDSFKGYKRPRIQSNLGFTSSLESKHMLNCRPGDYLNESVFTTPADDNIVRPDGMLTENPLPQSRKVALRSIKDFVLEKSPNYESQDSTLTEEELEVNNNDSNNSPQLLARSEVICKQTEEKSKFNVPFTSKNKSPELLTASSEVNHASSKSYESFLHSLIAPNSASGRNGSDEISYDRSRVFEERNDEQEETCMMSIMEWKAKGRNLKDDHSNSIHANSVEKEPVDISRSYVIKSTSNNWSGNKNVESLSLEIELREEEFHYGNQLRSEDENSIKYMSTYNSQVFDVEMEARADDMAVESLDSFREEQEVGTFISPIDAILGKCDISDFVDEVIQKALNRIGSSVHSSLKDSKCAKLPARITDKSRMDIEFQNSEFIFDIPKAGTMTKETINEFGNESEQSVARLDRKMEVITSKNDSDIDTEMNCTTREKILYKNILTDANRISEHIEQIDNIPRTEYADMAIQYSQQSPKLTLMHAAVGSPLNTDSKYCQSVVSSYDKACQTVMSDSNIIKEVQVQETQTDTRNLFENKVFSQEIQTEKLTRTREDIRTDISRVLFPSMTDPERASSFLDRDSRDEYENYILRQQQLILALEKEIDLLKL